MVRRRKYTGILVFEGEGGWGGGIVWGPAVIFRGICSLEWKTGKTRLRTCRRSKEEGGGL